MLFLDFLYSISLELIIVVLILLVVIIWRCLYASDLATHIEELDVNSLRTGDLLGAAYTKTFGWFVRSWTNSIWSHVGMVWRDPDSHGLFVLEAALYEAPYRGVIKIPLDRWLYIHRRTRIGLSRLEGPALPAHRVLEIFETKQGHVSLDTYNTAWYRLLWKRSRYATIRNEFTCYELITVILQDLGVVRPLYESSSYFPGDLMNQRLDLHPEYHYSSVRQLELSKENLVALNAKFKLNSNI